MLSGQESDFQKKCSEELSQLSLELESHEKSDLNPNDRNRVVFLMDLIIKLKNLFTSQVILFDENFEDTAFVSRASALKKFLVDNNGYINKVEARWTRVWGPSTKKAEGVTEGNLYELKERSISLLKRTMEYLLSEYERLNAIPNSKKEVEETKSRASESEKEPAGQISSVVKITEEVVGPIQELPPSIIEEPQISQQMVPHEKPQIREQIAPHGEQREEKIEETELDIMKEKVREVEILASHMLTGSPGEVHNQVLNVANEYNKVQALFKASKSWKVKGTTIEVDQAIAEEVGVLSKRIKNIQGKVESYYEGKLKNYLVLELKNAIGILNALNSSDDNFVCIYRINNIKKLLLVTDLLTKSESNISSKTLLAVAKDIKKIQEICSGLELSEEGLKYGMESLDLAIDQIFSYEPFKEMKELEKLKEQDQELLEKKRELEELRQKEEAELKELREDIVKKEVESFQNRYLSTVLYAFIPLKNLDQLDFSVTAYDSILCNKSATKEDYIENLKKEIGFLTPEQKEKLVQHILESKDHMLKKEQNIFRFGFSNETRSVHKVVYMLLGDPIDKRKDKTTGKSWTVRFSKEGKTFSLNRHANEDFSKLRKTK